MVVESKVDEPATAQKADEDPLNNSKTSENNHVESENEDDDDETPGPQPEEGSAASPPAKKKKKKPKKKRIKEALTGGDGKPSEEKIHKALGGMSEEQVIQMLELNPALANELGLGNLPMKDVTEKLKTLDLSDIMTGLAQNGKNVKDMASYKFWGTQPVPKFGENKNIVEGPFKKIDIDQVPKEPAAMVDGFEWVTMDITNDEEVQEITELLYGHYVEDNEASFRFNYSAALLKW